MLASVLLSLLLGCVSASSSAYYGKKLGYFSTLEHAVSGLIYAVDSKTIHIRGFNYDGQAPDAYFYVGLGRTPSGRGTKVPAENGSTKPLRRYRDENLTLTLPKGTTLDQVQWISVWCHDYSVDFGNLVLSKPVSDYPRPQKIGRFTTRENGVKSSQAVVVDSKTLLIPDFNYNGEGPDAHFWAGVGKEPAADGFIVPNENGNHQPLASYDHKTIVLTLPGDVTVFDIDYLGVWCESYGANFGHLAIDHRYLNVPPSLRVLGVRPQSKLNCELLEEEVSFEVRWAVAGESIVMQLVGKLDDGQFMAFGVSGSGLISQLEGADLTVAWMNRRSGQGHASDHTVSSDQQTCIASQGLCRDSQLNAGQNNIRLLNSAFINGFSMLTFQRPLLSSDQWDKNITTEREQAIVWAIGAVDSQGSVETIGRHVSGNIVLEFGRAPLWNCPADGVQSVDSSAPHETPEHSASLSARHSQATISTSPAAAVAVAPAAVAVATNEEVVESAWHVPPIPCHEPADRVYYAQMGPTGGRQGFSAITGWPGWSLAWYINGLLIPEMNVVRGKTYTFVVEGGTDPHQPAKYHPFYITDDPEGGYQFKTEQERLGIRIFAGVGLDSRGEAVPTATGRLCQWSENSDYPADVVPSFGAYQRTLQLDCESGQPGILQWTPDHNTPDTVYYQCFTHRYLGWKINVLDECFDETTDKTSVYEFNYIDGMVQADYSDYDVYYDSLAEASAATGQTHSLTIHQSQPSSYRPAPAAVLGDSSAAAVYPLRPAPQPHSAHTERETYGNRVPTATVAQHHSADHSHRDLESGILSRKSLLTTADTSSGKIETSRTPPSAAGDYSEKNGERRTDFSSIDEYGSASAPPTPAGRRQALLQSWRRRNQSSRRNTTASQSYRRRRPHSNVETQKQQSSDENRNNRDETSTSQTTNRIEDSVSSNATNILSHPQPSHNQGIASEVASFNPKEVVFETGFKPLAPEDPNSPVLAFEVGATERVTISGYDRYPISPLNTYHKTKLESSPFLDSPPQAMKIPLPVSLVPVAPSLDYHDNESQYASSHQSHSLRPTEEPEYTVELGPIPPPPHLTKEILPNAIVFSADELPFNLRPVDHGYSPSQPSRHPHLQYEPTKRPVGFLQSLLSYIPGFGASKPARRHYQPPAYHKYNPNRALQTALKEAPAGHPSRGTGATLAANRAPYHSSELRRRRLPTVPRLQPVIDSGRFLPPPIDLTSFTPLSGRHEPADTVSQSALLQQPISSGELATKLASDDPEYGNEEIRVESDTPEKVNESEAALQEVWKRMQQKRASQSS